MARLTLLLVLVALALPSAALAASGSNRDAARERALATERYYQSYGTARSPPGPPRRGLVRTQRTVLGRRRGARRRAGRCWPAASARTARGRCGRAASARRSEPEGAPSGPLRRVLSLRGGRRRGDGRPGVGGGEAADAERDRISAIRPSPAPGIVSHQREVADDRGLAPTVASTLTPGEPSAFIITTDQSPERTFQSSGAAVGRGRGPERLGGGHRGASPRRRAGSCRA